MGETLFCTWNDDAVPIECVQVQCRESPSYSAVQRQDQIQTSIA